MSSRIRISEEGVLDVVDPGFEMLPLLKSLDPEYIVRSAPIPGFETPRILRTKNSACGLTFGHLRDSDSQSLQRVHASVTAGITRSTESAKLASILDLKTELAWRGLTNCCLCPRNCGVNRTKHERGICGLGVEALTTKPFVHIAEEAFINPSLVFSLAGCALRCRYCQQFALLNPKKAETTPLGAVNWRELPLSGARSISFIGGNPDESLYGVLRFLSDYPESLDLPIVWNSHAYSSRAALDLLSGIVDVYVPDLKYGTDECGRRLAAVENYPSVALAAIQHMLSQQVPVIVRVLVLPGHNECCHKQSLETLAELGRKNLYVSIRDQYVPDWRITQRDGQMARRPSYDEITEVMRLARELGLTLVQ